MPSHRKGHGNPLQYSCLENLRDGPLGGTRRVGGLLGVAGRLSGTVSRCSGQGPHLAMTGEPEVTIPDIRPEGRDGP